MKAVKILLILAMTCVLFSAQGIAMSEDNATTPPLRHILDVKLTAEPAEMVGAGNVTLDFEIHNTSAFDAENIIYANALTGLQEALGQVAAGDLQVFTREYTVSEEELASGEIKFVVFHDDITGNGEYVDYEVSARIEKVAPCSEVEFTRRISSVEVVPGTAVSITYCVKNTGNVPAENIKVRDELGEFVGKAEILACGEEKIFTSSVVIEDDAESRASVLYDAPLADEKKREIVLDVVNIRAVQPALTAEFVLDSESADFGEVINGVVTVTAEGSDFRDVCVIDDITGVIAADCLAVSDGESIDIPFSRPVRSPSEIRFAVSGISGTGDIYEAVSNSETLTLSGEFSESELYISAQSETPVICEPGKVRVQIAIGNTGNASARNVTLRETNLGEMRRFDFIPAGEPTYREVIVEVEEDTTFEFCVCVDDENGLPQTVHAVAVPITISPEGAKPIADSDEGTNGIIAWINRNMAGADTYARLLAVAVAIIGILVIILVLSHTSEIVRRKSMKASAVKAKGKDERRGR